MKVKELIECLKGHEDKEVIIGVQGYTLDLEDGDTLVVKADKKNVYLTDNCFYEHLNHSVFLTEED